MTLLPGVAVSVVSGADALMQSVEALAGSAITNPDGKLSVKSKLPTREGLAMLSMVNVRVLRPPRGTELGAKLLLKPGRLVVTV